MREYIHRVIDRLFDSPLYVCEAFNRFSVDIHDSKDEDDQACVHREFTINKVCYEIYVCFNPYKEVTRQYVRDSLNKFIKHIKREILSDILVPLFFVLQSDWIRVLKSFLV